MADAVYAVYFALLLGIIVVVPVVRWAVLAVAEALPEVGLEPRIVGPVLVLITAVLALCGAQTGPVRATLPQIDLLLVTSRRRSRLLGGAVFRGIALGAAAGTFPGGVVALARWLVGGSDPLLSAALVLGGAGIGVLAVVAVAAGQLSRGLRTALTLGLVSLAAAQAASGFAGDPWAAYATILALASGGAATAAMSAAPLGWAAAIGASASLAALTLPRVANAMRWETLRAQAERVSAVNALAISADMRAAGARLGVPVRCWRRLGWRSPARLTPAIVARDAIGVFRTPARSIAALAGVTASGVLTAAALGLTRAGEMGGWGAATTGGIAMLLAYLSLAPWCRGLRAAAEGVGAAPLLPVSTGGLLRRHLVLPLLLGVGSAGTGVVLAAGGMPPAEAEPGVQGAAGVVLAATALLLRLLAALKGPLPQRFLAPVPTPAGDMAGVSVVLWTIDGPLVAVLVGAMLAGVAGTGSAGGNLLAALLAAALLGVLALWSRARLARAR